MQTESAYWQPSPKAPAPFTSVSALNDPTEFNSGSGWALRILNTKNFVGYGAGHYSFFDSYGTSKFMQSLHCM